MASAVSFKVTGLDKLIKACDTFPITLAKDIDKEIEDTCRNVILKAKQRAPVHDNLLRERTDFKQEKTGNFVIFSDTPYAPYMEFGTGPKADPPAELAAYAQQFRGKGTGTYDEMIDKLTRWVKRKGIAATQIKRVKSGKNKGKFKKAGTLAQGIYERQLAKFIAFLILKNGLKPRPYFFNSWFEERPKLGQKIKGILKNRGFR